MCSDGKWGWNVNQGDLMQSLPSHVERTQQVAKCSCNECEGVMMMANSC